MGADRTGRGRAWRAMPAAGLMALFGFLAFPGQPQAALITRTYDFTVVNVQDMTGNHVAAPETTVSGSISVSFDPSLGAIINQTAGLVVHSLNVAVGSPLAFSYNPANTDEIQIGGLDQGTNGLTDGVADFLLDIFDASGASPFFGNMDYTIFATTIATGQFSDFAAPSRADGTVTVETASAVPEPGALATFLIGLGLLAAIAASRVRGKAGTRVG